MRLACLISLAIVLFPNLTLAAPGCSVFSSKAQVGDREPLALKVGRGPGFDANFIPTGEAIEKVWLDDQTRINISFDGKMCEWTSEKQADCQSGANIIHLRQHEPIEFPNQISNPDGSTGLSVRTVDSNGRPKFYKFTVIPVAAGKPVDCSSLTIYPDPEHLSPLLPRVTNPNQQPSSQVTTPTRSIQQTKASTTANKQAAAAQAGLKLAYAQRQIQPDSVLWQQALVAIELLNRGVSIESAAAQSNISLSVLIDLIGSGQKTLQSDSLFPGV